MTKQGSNLAEWSDQSPLARAEFKLARAREWKWVLYGFGILAVAGSASSYPTGVGSLIVGSALLLMGHVTAVEMAVREGEVTRLREAASE
jgi:hypothetical protein